MAQEVERLSDGQLRMQIYPSGQLGAERELLELLQIGSLEITKVSSSIMENFVPDYQVLSLPYVFEDRAHAYRFFTSDYGKQMLQKGEDVRLRGLCFYDAGSRSFYSSKRPISSPSDLEGKKIRVQKSRMAVEMVRLLGGAPTPISWGELYTALQQGVVDGAENNPPSFYLSRHYEVCKYYSLDEHTQIPDVLLISALAWSKLNQQEKEWLQQAADASAQQQKQLWQQAEAEAFAGLEQAGVEIRRVQKAPFLEKVQPMYAQLQQDSTMNDYMRAIKRMKITQKQEDDSAPSN